MIKDSAGSETFVVRAGFWRIVLLGPLMLIAALVFFFLALVMLFVSVGNVLGKLAMVAIALALAPACRLFPADPLDLGHARRGRAKPGALPRAQLARRRGRLAALSPGGPPL